MATLVSLINYNPSKPENMNIYLHPHDDDMGQDEGAMVFISVFVFVAALQKLKTLGLATLTDFQCKARDYSNYQSQ